MAAFGRLRQDRFAADKKLPAMDILFLGGTGFVGRHIAEAAIAAGNTVTFFNRGISDDSLFEEQRRLRGDRAGDVSVLGTVNADVVIDTSGYTPDAVSASALAVADTVRKYVFMSSVDVYDKSVAFIDESSATLRLPAHATTSERVPELYGAHKARCEQELINILGADRVISVRAGLMVGPYDNTDRFTYWPVRVARGGEILVPVGREMPVQIIDPRDVAQWILRGLSLDLQGPFNLVGTPKALDFGDVLDVCQAASQTAAGFTWVTSEFLEANDVGAWVELPLWIPHIPELLGSRNIANDRARSTGLRIRPLLETVEAVLDEYRLRPAEYALRAGLAPERESSLLQRWYAGTATEGT